MFLLIIYLHTYLAHVAFSAILRPLEDHLALPVHFRSEPDVCQTDECKQFANNLLANMNQTVNPCDDFYEFTCGGYLATHEVADDKMFVSVYLDVINAAHAQIKELLDHKLTGSEPEFVKMMKNMYDTCMDTQHVEENGNDFLQKKLESLGGWPVAEGDKWDGSKFDWLDKLIALRRLGYNHNSLMYVGVDLDAKNNTAHIIELDQPGLGMSRTYLMKGLNESTTQAYFNLMRKAAEKLGASQPNMEAELMDVFNFETSLAKILVPKQERRNLTKLYNKYTIKELQEWIPQIDWLKYFNGLLPVPIISPSETIIVSVPDFIKKFSELMQNTDKRTIANYMMWRVVKFLMPYLSKDWRDLSMEYVTATGGSTKETPRFETCLDSLGKFKLALSSYYVTNYFSKEGKDKAVEMVNYIQREFLDLLNNIDWMDKDTKSHAVEKANAMLLFVGYPEELMNDALLMEHYENLTIRGDNHLDNVLNLKKWYVDKQFSKLRKSNVRGDWKSIIGSMYVNAFYNPSHNNIEIPAAILQKEFFNKNVPYYLNFGGIGATIGHEITHGFDNMGRQYDKNGKNVNWWDENTDKLFKEKVNCIIEQYGNYTTEIGLKLNGENTQGENIADIAGLKLAYKAYQTWVKERKPEPQLPGLNYTPNQMFWISSANIWCNKDRPEFLKMMVAHNPHAPERFRVIGTVSNLEEFSQDFQCPSGSNMNPQKKCEVW